MYKYYYYKEGKLKFTFKTILLLTGWQIVLVTPMIICAVISLNSILDFSAYFSQILDNWDNEVIQDLQFVRSSQECPVGYDSEIFQFTFQGTLEGCQCGNIVTFGECDLNCPSPNNFMETPPQQMNILGFVKDNNQVIGAKLCAKRIKGYSFFSKTPLSYKCANNEKMCGGKNNKEAMFCVPLSEKCPITKISFLNIPNAESIPILSTFQLLYLQREGEEYPLVQLTASMGGGVCLNSFYNNYPQGTKSYPLYRGKQCEGDELDSRYIDSQISMNEATFFSVNNQNYDLKLNCPMIEFRTNQFYNLYYRNYLQLAFQCRPQVVNYYQNQGKLNEYMKIMIIQLIVISIFGTFIVFGEITFLCCQRTTQCSDMKYRIGYAIPKISMFMSCFVVSGLCLRYNLSIKEFINGLLDQSCVDNITFKQIQDINSNFKGGYVEAIFGLLIVYFFTDWMFLLLVVSLYNGCAKKQLIQEQEQNPDSYQQYNTNKTNNSEPDEQNQQYHKENEQNKKKQQIFLNNSNNSINENKQQQKQEKDLAVKNISVDDNKNL